MYSLCRNCRSRICIIIKSCIERSHAPAPSRCLRNWQAFASYDSNFGCDVTIRLQKLSINAHLRVRKMMSAFGPDSRAPNPILFSMSAITAFSRLHCSNRTMPEMSPMRCVHVSTRLEREFWRLRRVGSFATMRYVDELLTRWPHRPGFGKELFSGIQHLSAFARNTIWMLAARFAFIISRCTGTLLHISPRPHPLPLQWCERAAGCQRSYQFRFCCPADPVRATRCYSEWERRFREKAK